MNIELEFIANLINERETKKKGHSMPVRWRCLRQDLRNKYLTEAQDIVNAWLVDEQRAQESRDASESGYAVD